MIFDHVGIVVRELSTGRSMLSAAFGIQQWTTEFEDPVNDVYLQFGRCPIGMCYEIIAPRSVRSPVRNAIERRNNVLNHLAYRVHHLARQANHLQANGFLAVGEPLPAIAFGDREVQFFANAAPLLVELIEAPDHEHIYVDVAADPNRPPPSQSGCPRGSE